MYGYIYFTENICNGRYYIGQHKAERFDSKYKGSGKLLKQAFNKYGKDKFICQLIQWCETKEDLDKSEKYWIDKCQSSSLYNIKEGGSGGSYKGINKGIPKSKEHRYKLSEARKRYVTQPGCYHKVINLDTGETFNSVKEASISVNGCRHQISRCCNGRYESAYGFHWKYLD